MLGQPGLDAVELGYAKVERVIELCCSEQQDCLLKSGAERSTIMMVSFIINV